MTRKHNISQGAFERRFDASGDAPVAIPAWWQSSYAQVIGQLDDVTCAKRSRLALSSGGRQVDLLTYGPDSPRGGQANRNSALGAGQATAYCARAVRACPVLMVIAGVHGAEVEGMVAATSLLRILETGNDLRGRPQPVLYGLLQRLRVVVVPLANPDGRERVPYAGFVGVPSEEMSRVNQGTRADGSLWGWPACKTVHPMHTDAGGLGGYFDDAGVNLMHDEWHAPLSPVTRPLLDCVAREAPDLLLNLHSHCSAPGFLPTAYVPRVMKEALGALAQGFIRQMQTLGLPSATVPALGEDGVGKDCPPALNLASICYHVGAELSALFESPHGVSDNQHFDYEQILDLHHVLFTAAAEHCLGVNNQ